MQPFPTIGLLPKSETGALRFLEQHPEYDGRGIIVAIFDTGVDPGAAGLSVTSDGQPKIVDLIDGTGDGDVVMGDKQTAEDGQIEGLTGRRLKVNPDWKNPTGEYRVGLKRAYDLFPSDLVERLQKERRHEWDRRQTRRLAELRSLLHIYYDDLPELSPKQVQGREEMQARIDVLEDAQESYDDPGPLYDCVVYHDGEVWRAVIDTDEDGQLTDEVSLTDYHKERQFATFSEPSQLNFSVNIYDEGKRLSIVTVCGEHGTHVAGIVAAYEAEQPERNGVAPGAQIVSVKIGDNRIVGLESGRAMVRGLRAVIDRKCDLINMSYGEPTSTPDEGRLAELFSEIVDEHGVIFVASAGNAGPALSTVGAPGGTTEALLGIGAYVSSEMMSPQYGLRETLDGMPYTWTSRGPSTDGAMGVDLFAPGGAFSPVPNYSLQRSMQANGTSMASPNACGCIALLLSGMRAQGTLYRPAFVRRALENTALRLPGVDPFAQGTGLIQVDKAWEWIEQGEYSVAERHGFRCEVARDKSRGVLLREAEETSRLLETDVAVTPYFRRDQPKLGQVKFEIPLTLESTADWVDVSETMLMTASGDGFELQVDPRRLKPGVHTAEVRGYHAGRESRGPLFRVPVTVIRPIDVRNHELEEKVTLGPGHLERRFVSVPQGATWADVEIELEEADAPRILGLHTVQILPGHSFEDGETQKRIQMEQGSQTIVSLPVVAGRTLELCLSQYWSSLGKSQVTMSIEFRGLLPDNDELTLPSDGSPLEVMVASQIRREKCEPHGSLTTLRRLLRPTSAKDTPLLSDRDRQMDGGPTNQLLLTYDFSLTSDSDVTIGLPELEGLLYDSPVEGFEWQVFDENKRLLGTGDMYPAAVSLDEGDYTVRLELRHADRDELEGYKSVLLSVDRNLSKSIAVGVKADRMSKFDATWLDPGETASVFLTGPDADALPNEAEPGDLLRGTMHYVKSPDGGEGASSRPDGYPVSFVVPAKPAKEKDSPEAAEPEESLTKRLQRERLDSLIKQLGELQWPRDEELYRDLARSILEEHPEAEQRIRVATLHLVDGENRKEHLSDVIAAADDVIDTIRSKKLTRLLALRANPDQPETVKRKKRAEEQRDILVDALYRKGRALAYQELPDVVEKHPIEDQAALDTAFEDNFQQLARWVDTSEEKYSLLHIRRNRRLGRYGAAIKLLNERIEDTSPPTYLQHKKRRDLYELLGWDDWQAYENKWMLIGYPKQYPAF
ncbi:MAG: tripeptidyl-peptidase 2 [Planctomycetaceae bacterium]